MPAPRPAWIRFCEKVAFGDGCWPWLAFTQNGYGTMHLRGRPVLAHRFSYELVNGPIPEGLHLHHLCHNRACVNPSHLEPITPQAHPSREALRNRTHCHNGHEYTPENTAYRRDNSRRCRQCYRDYNRSRYHARRLAEKAC